MITDIASEGTLINFYLRNCAETGRRLSLDWKSVA